MEIEKGASEAERGGRNAPGEGKENDSLLLSNKEKTSIEGARLDMQTNSTFARNLRGKRRGRGVMTRRTQGKLPVTEKEEKSRKDFSSSGK